MVLQVHSASLGGTPIYQASIDEACSDLEITLHTQKKSYPAKTLAGLPVMRKPVKKTFADILGITCYSEDLMHPKSPGGLDYKHSAERSIEVVELLQWRF